MRELPHRIICFAVVSSMLLLGGCGRLRPTSRPEIPIADYLPAGWAPIGELHAVNIDGDASTEYLLFYVYDSTGDDDERLNGPVGALIYDSQTDIQQGVNFHTYRILPSYWTTADPAIVAMPDQQEQIEVSQVTRTDPAEVRTPGAQSDATAPATTEVPGAADELIIQAGNTRLTVVWWQNALHGYGVTQVYAPGGLHELTYGPGATDDEGETISGPVLSMVGHFPLYDRSLLCYQIRYVRTPEPVNADTPTEIYRPAIRYQEFKEGLRFCNGAPEHPFYPEGVTLAYLLDPLANSHLLHPSLAAEERERITAYMREITSAPNSTLRVDDVKAYRGIPAPAGGEVTELTMLGTSTCANVVTNDQPQALLFTLSHLAPNVETHTSDRLFIEQIEPIPAPPDGPVVECNKLIKNGVPERRWREWY